MVSDPSWHGRLAHESAAMAAETRARRPCHNGYETASKPGKNMRLNNPLRHASAALSLLGTAVIITGISCDKPNSATAAPASPAGAAQVDEPKVPVGEWPMWGLTPHRNLVSLERNPPTDWDIETGKNILWSQ